jgi:ABC-type molybdate transport system substrate-binding protein
MIQTSLAKRIALIAVSGLMPCLFAAVASSAAEIKVLTSVALTAAFKELASNFEQATGNKLNIGYRAPRKIAPAADLCESRS